MGDARERQVAALPWRRSERGLDILLITSRETKRWVTPKGWPMKGKHDCDAAAQEAYEEAGIQGSVQRSAIGAFHYVKRRKSGDINMTVDVYPLMVEAELTAWPEQSQRTRQWFPQQGAARLVAEPELQMLISQFEVHVPFFTRVVEKLQLSLGLAPR